MKVKDLFHEKQLHENIDKYKEKIAKKMGLSVSTLSSMSDEEIKIILKDVGKHDFAPDDNFDPHELKMGIEIEKEHTNSELVAKLIAQDHLSEPGNKNYYTKLKAIEKNASN